MSAKATYHLAFLCFWRKFAELPEKVMHSQEIIISKDPDFNFSAIIKNFFFDKLFILTDECTYKLCLPFLVNHLKPEAVFCIRAGENHKSLESLAKTWRQLTESGATRSSLLINLGGGMVTDLGGFAAATFKRGISFINIPTTLLGMVDAATGGKTGINFNGLKNEIGTFAKAKYVLINARFLQTLDAANFLSGYAEMLKHGLIDASSHWTELLNFDICLTDFYKLTSFIEKSIRIKEQIIKTDPYEHNIRKALNLGHTAGHAFESLALEEDRPILHGYAVAWGMICELYLSYLKTGFPQNKLRQIITFIKEHYGTFFFTCQHYDRLYQFMLHDKKNMQPDTVNFTLLEDTGKIQINQTATQSEIFDAFDFYRECM